MRSFSRLWQTHRRYPALDYSMLCHSVNVSALALKTRETEAGLVNAVTYSSVLKSFNQQKRFHRVWEVYDEMIQHKAMGLSDLFAVQYEHQ